MCVFPEVGLTACTLGMATCMRTVSVLLFLIACLPAGFIQLPPGHMNALLASCTLLTGWIDCMYVLHGYMYAAILLFLCLNRMCSLRVYIYMASLGAVPN